MTEPVRSGPGRFPRGAGAPGRSGRSGAGVDAPVSEMTGRHIHDCQAYRSPTLSSVPTAVGARSSAGAAG